MSLKRVLYNSIVVCVVFIRCAQVAPLNGGNQDTSPPKLLEAKPLNASLNFNSGTIELKFDEFVQVVDMANQVLITPQTKELPLIEARGKKIVIKFTETLLPNTTYRLYFGNAIADMHERNILANFEYVFSTGSSIDSMHIRGTIRSAFTLKPEKDVTVALYEVNETDSVVFKKKPAYLTKTNTEGNYKISYLPKAKFMAYAFSDKNKNMVYDGGEEQIAFSDSITETPADSIINFRMFKEGSAKTYIKRAYSFLYGQASIVYNKEILNKVSALNKDQKTLIRSNHEVNDTCVVYYHGIYDTLNLLIAHASSDEIDTVKVSILSKDQFEKQKKGRKIVLDMIPEPLENGKLAFYNKLSLVFSKWIDPARTDTSKIKFSSKDDTLFKPLPQLSELDINKLNINNKFVQGSEYQLLFNKGAFTDKNGIESDSALFKIKISSKEDYANLNLKLIFPQKESYIVQIVNGFGKIIAEQYLESSIASSSEKILKFNYLIPGEYFVKVIEDKNKNKIWDTGNLMMKKQPETIYFNAQAIKLLPDWDADIEWKVTEN